MERTESVGDERATPSPEVLERPVRRRFTVEYKAKSMGKQYRLFRRVSPFSSLRTVYPILWLSTSCVLG